MVRQVRRAGNCLVIYLAGEIDFSSARRVRQQVTGAMDSARLWRVVLDLREVTFCDSSALRALVTIWKTADRHAGGLTLARVPPACELPLVLTGLNKSLGTWPTITDAVASMRSRTRPQSPTARELIENLAAASQPTGTVSSADA